MRNLLLFLLILIGIYYLRRMMANDSADRSGGAAGPGAPTPPPQVVAEQVLPCAHCGLLVPASEGVQAQGQFYCSPEHLRLGPGAS